MHPIAPSLWETLAAVDKPWFWLLFASWMVVSDLTAPRWHRAWNAGAIAATWMGVALTVLPWHLFDEGVSTTLGMWAVWVASAVAVALGAVVLEAKMGNQGRG
jgi:cytosine/uracil/thiamine/allantoin permease